MTKTEEYLSRFPAEFVNDRDRRMLAFRIALEMRNFEIELYWKRATYFWAFFVIAFGGFGAAIAKANHGAAFIVANIGLVLSSAFIGVHKGSKFWQENWENHVAVLGEATIGGLFSQILRRKRGRPWLHRLAGPSGVSVSRVNEFLSIYLWFIWLGCVLYSSPLKNKAVNLLGGHTYLWTACFTAAYIIVFTALSRSALGKHEPYVQQHSTEISA